jgi:hypothetical protein
VSFDAVSQVLTTEISHVISNTNGIGFSSIIDFPEYAFHFLEP